MRTYCLLEETTALCSRIRTHTITRLGLFVWAKQVGITGATLAGPELQPPSPGPESAPVHHQNQSHPKLDKTIPHNAVARHKKLRVPLSVSAIFAKALE